jgi:5'-deoxynucleotidase YfbR-like HD superfamily hydrolase
MNVGITCIETASGRFVDLLNPLPDQICIEDMAWSMSRQARYAGHTITPLIYSIAQHSLVVEQLVSRLMDKEEEALRQHFYNETGWHGEISQYITPEILLHALMHDGSEAYLLDLPTPLKQLPDIKEAYGALEEKMMSAIWLALDLSILSSSTHDIIRWADRYALTVEAHHLIRSRGQHWTRLTELSLLELNDFEHALPSDHIYQCFITRYFELKSAQAAQ